MSIEQGAAEADVLIRVPRREWVRLFVLGGWFFVLAAFTDQAGLALLWLALGGAVVARGLFFRRFAVDLTAESANLRGLCWRSVPWTRVQAVVRHRRRGEWVVRLILDGGELVTLRDPATWRRFGDAEHEASFQRIQRWWLAHRGQSWCPLPPEAPPLPVRR
jgi:hypothetical protein